MLDSDFAFHWDGGGDAFAHLQVVRFDIDDPMSHPFEAKLLLHTRKADDDIDPYDLVGKLGTLRIATASEPAVRAFHGLIVSAEDRGVTSVGGLYEIVMMPPLARAMHRRRSRIFFEKTLKQIVEAVLTGDPKMSAGDSDGSTVSDLRGDWAVPEEKFVWRVSDTSRLDDAKVRPHCAQYEESDFDFIGRLLEEEGITYHFEHTAKQIVLVLSDNDSGRQKLDPFDPLSPTSPGRELDGMRSGGRLRPTKVKLVDYNWKKPKLDMGTEAKGEADDLFVQAYPGRFHEEPDQGATLAKAALERFQSEARHATASGACRLLGGGSIFKFESTLARVEGEYLVTKARLRGRADGELPGGRAMNDPLPNGGAFHAELELVRRGTAESAAESKYRPARRTPKPQIVGTQTATVVDEPSARGVEIHVGGPEGNENGCVRLKFHWDTETERHDKEPTSMWVRVSQVFAGAGGGSVAHPRVGTEVIVSYEDGDPDRPIVVGRVYNGIQPSAALGKGAATVTTMKSLASPGGKVFNEFQFDDTAGKEKVNLTAGKDWNSNVGNNRSESISNDSTSSVTANRSEDTGADRKTSVSGNNTESIGGDESMSVGGNQTESVGGNEKLGVGGNQEIGIGGNRSLKVGGSHAINVSGAEDHLITGAHALTVSAAQAVTVSASKADDIGADYGITVGAAMSVTVSGAVSIKAGASITQEAPKIANNCSDFGVDAGGKAVIKSSTFLADAGGVATVQGGTVHVTAGGDVVISGANVQIKGGSISLEGGSVKIAGGTVDITGGVVNVN